MVQANHGLRKERGMHTEVVRGKRIDAVVGPTLGPYAHAVKVKGGTLVFLAGQAAVVHGEVVGKGDIGAQYKQIMENFKAILEDAGGSTDDIIQMTHYVTKKLLFGDPEYDAMREVRAQYITGDPPASAVVHVISLMLDDVLIEVTGVAVIGE